MCVHLRLPVTQRKYELTCMNGFLSCWREGELSPSFGIAWKHLGLQSPFRILEQHLHKTYNLLTIKIKPLYRGGGGAGRIYEYKRMRMDISGPYKKTGEGESKGRL